MACIDCTQILRVNIAFSREKSLINKKYLGAIFRRLRVEILDFDKRWVTAASLLMSPDIYANWENGRSYPNAAETLNILRTFPEAAALFGLDIPPRVKDTPLSVTRDVPEPDEVLTTTRRGVKLVPKNFNPGKPK